MNDPLDQLRPHFTGLWLREEGQQGRVYGGQDPAGAEVTIAVLTAPTASDPGLRNAFADAVWQHSVGSVPGRATVYAADLHAAQPWAATRNSPGDTGAEQLLSAVASAAPTSPLTPTPPGMPQPPNPPHPAAAQAVSPGVPGPPPGFGQGTPMVPPPGAGGEWEPAKRSGSPWPWVLGATAGVVVLALVATVGVLVVQRFGGEDDPEPPPVALPTTGPTQSAPTESPEPEPTESPGSPSGEPELRSDVEPVSVVGPTYEGDEDTFTMAFRDWPFAFRAPADWNCFKGEFPPAEEAEAWGCNGEAGKANVLLWECETTCTEDEQQEMNETWLDEPDQAVPAFANSPTVYVEKESSGVYSVDLSHYAGNGPDDDTLRYLVGVYIESRVDDKGIVQKVMNDIVTQSGGR